MAIIKFWAGRVFGTNTGNLFVSLEGDDNALTGKLRLMDEQFGVAVYAISGVFDGQKLNIRGEVEGPREGLQFGSLTATATLNQRGDLRGTWETTIGSGGTFVLHPHDHESRTPEASPADQLYSARYDLGAIAISRRQLEELAEQVQAHFADRPVMVNVTLQTERIRTLADFKKLTFGEEQGRYAKIFGQEMDASTGINRTVIIELSATSGNSIVVQGSDESWVLGVRERLKQELAPRSRFYPSQYKKFGINFNQVVAACAVAVLPSLPDFWSRLVFIVAILFLLHAIVWVHAKFLPFTTIYLGEKRKGFWPRILPSAISIIITVLGGALATILAGFLQGWLKI